MRRLSPEHARWMRGRGQAIGGGVRLGSVAEIIDRVFAIQSQDASAAALGLRARGLGLTADDVRRAAQECDVVRGWLLRGTLHTVPGADYRWLLGLYGPVGLRAGARRYRELGLDDALRARADDLITDVLAAEGTATRSELTARLTGLGVDPDGQAIFHLLRHAALRGLICFGPERAGEPTFALLDRWLPHQTGEPSGDDAVAELARRYLRAHAPAGLDDFVVWSGLPTPIARRAWAALESSGETIPCEVLGLRCAVPVGRAAELDAEPGDRRDVRLLPMYDGYLVGYRTRELSVPRPHERAVRPGGGLIRATVTVDGLVIGTWSRARSGSRAGAGSRSRARSRAGSESGDGGYRAVGVRTELFDPAASADEGLASEIADVVRFLTT